MLTNTVKYLRMRKLELDNATYNLLTKFLLEKIMCLNFFTFLTWYEVFQS